MSIHFSSNSLLSICCAGYLCLFANDECLITLSLLQNLKSSSLLHCFEHVTFDNGILPFLQIRGQQLHTLSLHVAEVDAKIVGYFCPNLVKLDLEFQNNYTSNSSKLKIRIQSCSLNCCGSGWHVIVLV